MVDTVKDKVVVITGGAGTIGVPLAKELIELGAKTIRLFDQDDSALTFAFDKLNHDPKVRLFLGKIEDKERVDRALSGADIVFHLAAVKHVMIAEYNPFDTIQTNVNATQNIINSALKHGIRKVIFTSSDKAVNPPNTYGSTKLLGEKLMIAANLSKGPVDCIFSSVRFGNVIGSRGSVIPRFKEQLETENQILVTKRDLTRFVMFLSDAVRLLIKAATMSNGGEIFVLKMFPIKIGDLADVILDHYKDSFPSATQKEIGLFQGEKEFEELLDMGEELKRTVELDDMYVILPKYNELRKSWKGFDQEGIGKNINIGNLVSKSAKPISKPELHDLLIKNKLLN